MSRRTSTRIGEDIGTFARAFDRRAPGFNPHLIRATWDAFQQELDPGSRAWPLRPSDRLVEDLELDPESSDDVMLDVLTRTGRNTKSCAENPLYGRILTVADFVRFAEHQAPRAN